MLSVLFLIVFVVLVKMLGQKMFVFMAFYFISKRQVHKNGLVLSYISNILLYNNVNVTDEIRPTVMNVGFAVPFSCAPGK